MNQGEELQASQEATPVNPYLVTAIVFGLLSWWSLTAIIEKIFG